MKKSKFNIEYHLKNASLNIIWNSIGTPLGLSEWFSDNVTVENNVRYTFSWDDEEEAAVLLSSKSNEYIRFQWEEDEESDVYFELRLNTNELTGDLILSITDFAETGEMEDAVLLWNQQIDVLRRKIGV